MSDKYDYEHYRQCCKATVAKFEEARLKGYPSDLMIELGELQRKEIVALSVLNDGKLPANGTDTKGAQIRLEVGGVPIPPKRAKKHAESAVLAELFD